MKTNIKKILTSFLASIIILTSSFTSFASTQPVTNESELSGDYAQAIVRMAMSIVKDNYKYDISDEELLGNVISTILNEHPEVWEAAFKGIYNNLDEHSTYFTKEEYESFTNNLSGEVCGIGVSILEFEDGILITQVYKNSPAYEGGMESGDIIVSANGTDIRGMDINVARTYIIGEEGTTVKIGYVRNGVYKETVLTRRHFVVDSGIYYTLENNTIGYIQLYNFDEHANDFIESALSSFDSYGIKNIIMDLRNNPGGSLVALEEISQHFIPEGPIIHIEYKNPLKNSKINSTNKTPKYKLIILTNENTASAAEAFAGAAQDTGVGIVVGSQSYGKGTMQTITKFKVGGGIKLTEAEYLTPNKRNINGIGIEPDLKVKDMLVPYKDSNMKPVTYEKVLKLGDSGDDVTAIKERLSMLGYNIDMSNNVFDETTMYATKKFQEVTELFPYGVMDITTQVELENIFIGRNVSDNGVFNSAVDIFKNDTFKNYKHTWSPQDYVNRFSK